MGVAKLLCRPREREDPFRKHRSEGRSWGLVCHPDTPIIPDGPGPHLSKRIQPLLRCGLQNLLSGREDGRSTAGDRARDRFEHLHHPSPPHQPSPSPTCTGQHNPTSWLGNNIHRWNLPTVLAITRTAAGVASANSSCSSRLGHF